MERTIVNRHLIALLCLAPTVAFGQAIDAFPKTTTIVETDLMITQTNSAGAAGQKFTRGITWSNVLESLITFPNWPIVTNPTNIVGSTNGNQFLGVPLSVKSGATLTNQIFYPSNAAAQALTVYGLQSQSADLLKLKDYLGNDLVTVGSGGAFAAAGNISSTSGDISGAAGVFTSTLDVTGSAAFGSNLRADGELQIGNKRIKYTVGNGSPEGSVTANPQSVYLNTNELAGIGWYLKTNGTGNTGWWLLAPGGGGSGDVTTAQLNSASNVLRTDISNLQGGTNGLDALVKTKQNGSAGLTNLVGTVANNVTNENSTALQINSGTLTLTPGVLSNIVASGHGAPYIAVNTNSGTLANVTNLIFRSGVVVSNDSTGIASLHVATSGGSGGTNFPPVITATTNVTVGTGVRQSLVFSSPSNQFYNHQGTPLNGETILSSFTNGGATNVTWSFNINGSPSSYYDPRVASNVTSFVVAPGTILLNEWVYSTNNGARWRLNDRLGAEAELSVAGSLTLHTNSTGSSITISNSTASGSTYYGDTFTVYRGSTTPTSISLSGGIWLFDEWFVGDPSSSGRVGREAWTQSVGGTGLMTGSKVSAAGVIGTLSQKTSAGSDRTTVMILPNNSTANGMMSFTNLEMWVQTRFRIRNLNSGSDSNQFMIGFGNQLTAVPTEGLWFGVTNNTITGYSAISGLESTAVTSNAVADAWITGFVHVLNGTDSAFYVGTSLTNLYCLGTNTTKMPAPGNVNPFAMTLRTTGTTAYTNEIDYFRIWVKPQ